MKNIITAIVYFSIFQLSAQNLVWAKQFGSAGYDNSSAICIDAFNNVYTTGYFTNTIDFDTGPGTYTMTSAGNRDVFITKTDANGNFIWAKQLGGPNFDGGISIDVDSQGNIYTASIFQYSGDFDPGPTVLTFTATSGNIEIVINKMDAAGNHIWAKQFQTVNTPTAAFSSGLASLKVDGSGNVYVTGSFNNTIDFDPGPGTFTLSSNATQNVADVFFCKLDATGNFAWAKQIGDLNMNEEGHSIAIDASGNIFFTGNFNSTIDFDPGPATFTLSTSTYCGFISKMDNAGNFLWAKAFVSACMSSIDLDGAGNIYLGGYFSDTADLDPGTTSYTVSTSPSLIPDGFISKLDPSGNFIWAMQLGNVGAADAVREISVDAWGNVYAIGMFQNTVDFDPGPANNLLTSAGVGDQFVAIYTATGSFVSAGRTGSVSWEDAVGIAANNSGEIYLSGIFDNTVDVDPGTGIVNFTSAGATDFYIAKLTSVITGIASYAANIEQKINVFPNPVNDILNIEFKEVNILYKLTLKDQLGRIVYSGFSKNLKEEIDLSQLESGLYYLKAETEKGQQVFKVVKE
ncbi:MAG: T9SS type A sorting domain-containing protein [Bacteroidia bacterium]|nr:T9SS type A sorting domain-containing protein [Bacteroidia bacterium]